MAPNGRCPACNRPLAMKKGETKQSFMRRAHCDRKCYALVQGQRVKSLLVRKP
jgi:hypothetical protein